VAEERPVLSEESLFREVDEEVRQEQFKKLWERYGNLAMAFCVLVVLGVAGFKGWQYWQVKQAEAAAQVFFDAAKLAGTGKADEALKLYETVSQPGFGQLAEVRAASLLANQGKADEAVKAFDAVAADTGADRAIRDLARIRAGYALADTLKPDELKTRLAGLDGPGNPWRHQVREIIGIAAWRTGDFALASQTMKDILADAETPAGVRQRAQIISQLLEPLLPKK
jgi:hypothetical protein